MQKGFTLIELLIAFVILGIMAALVVPRFMDLQQKARTEVIAQQAEAIRDAVLAWMGSQASLSAASSAYGNNALISATAFTEVKKYLDEKTANNISTVASGTNVSCLRTQEMVETTNTLDTGTNYANRAVVFQSTSYTVTNPKPTTDGKYTACAVIYWPTGTTLRRNTQPTIVLFVP